MDDFNKETGIERILIIGKEKTQPVAVGAVKLFSFLTCPMPARGDFTHALIFKAVRLRPYPYTKNQTPKQAKSRKKLQACATFSSPTCIYDANDGPKTRKTL